MAYIDSFLSATFVSFDPAMPCNAAVSQHNAKFIQQLPLPARLYCNTKHPEADPACVADRVVAWHPTRRVCVHTTLMPDARAV